MTENKQALLVMDIQAFTVQMLGDSETYLNQLKKSIDKARSKNIPVIYIVVGFRNGYPEVSSNNKMFTMIKQMKFDTEDAYKVHTAVAPSEGDLIIIKKR